MSEMNVNQVLAQIRVLKAQAEGAGLPGADAAAPETSFSDMLKQSVDSVNQAQQTAAGLAAAFESGEGDASLAEIMVATQKSSLSFDAMLQVRNKLLDAYKDIMNMPM